jgi:hypothetical protein
MPRFTLLFALLLFLFACREEEENGESRLPDSQEEMPLPDSIDTRGLAFAQLESYIADVVPDTNLVLSVADTVVNQGGYLWLVRTLHTSQGPILLEGEFIDDRIANDTLLSESRINRIRIESSLFQTRQQLRVGSPLSALRQHYPDSLISVTPIPGFDMVQVQAGEESLFYLIFAPKLATQPQVQLAELPADARIEAIVVM